MWLYNKQDNIHIDWEWDFCTSHENYDESGYGFDLDLLTVLY